MLSLPQPAAIQSSSSETWYILAYAGMMEGSRIMFNMRFSLSNEETKEEQEMN